MEKRVSFSTQPKMSNTYTIRTPRPSTRPQSRNNNIPGAANRKSPYLIPTVALVVLAVGLMGTLVWQTWRPTITSALLTSSSTSSSAFRNPQHAALVAEAKEALAMFENGQGAGAGGSPDAKVPAMTLDLNGFQPSTSSTSSSSSNTIVNAAASSSNTLEGEEVGEVSTTEQQLPAGTPASEFDAANKRRKARRERREQRRNANSNAAAPQQQQQAPPPLAASGGVPVQPPLSQGAPPPPGGILSGTPPGGAPVLPPGMVLPPGFVPPTLGAPVDGSLANVNPQPLPPPPPIQPQQQPQQQQPPPPPPPPAPAAGATTATTSFPPGLHCVATTTSNTSPSPASIHPLLFKERYITTKVLPIERCENFVGNSWLRNMANTRRQVCKPGNIPAEDAANTKPMSRIWRYDATSSARFSWMRNVMVDFGKMRTTGDFRNFEQGFVQAVCDETAPGEAAHIGDGRAEPGLGAFLRMDSNTGAFTCDEWVDTPTLVIQHDDIGNMYHNLADHFRTWLALAMLQHPTCVPEADVKSSVPANTKVMDITSVSAGGRGAASICPAPTLASTYSAPVVGLLSPTDEVAHLTCKQGEVLVKGVDPDSMQLINLDGRIMCNVVNVDGTPVSGIREDCEGPYFPQYRKWFGKGVVKGRDFGSKKVCFSAIGWAVNAPESHPWAWFSEPSPCDGPAPLWQQYIDYVIERWGLTKVLPQVVNPTKIAAATTTTSTTPLPYFRILYVVRKKKPFNPAPVRDRVIANEDAFLAMLQSAVPNIEIEVDAADFTGMEFEEQLRRVRAAHLVIGMHGAGMVHGIHLAPHDMCGGPTGVIELLPAGHSEWGIGHLVSHEGHRYWRWVNSDQGRETGSGTNVDLDTVKALVAEAIQHTLGGRKKNGNKISPPENVAMCSSYPEEAQHQR